MFLVRETFLIFNYACIGASKYLKLYLYRYCILQQFQDANLLSSISLSHSGPSGDTKLSKFLSCKFSWYNLDKLIQNLQRMFQHFVSFSWAKLWTTHHYSLNKFNRSFQWALWFSKKFSWVFKVFPDVPIFPTFSLILQIFPEWCKPWKASPRPHFNFGK